MTVPTLTDRALNRATLQRQLLLDRADLPAEEAVEHLVALQTQAPDAPYVGLWTRLRAFQPERLAALIADRRAVRATVLRGTVHLVTAGDYPILRAWVQPLLERLYKASPFAKSLAAAGVDPADVVSVALRHVGERPQTRAQLSANLGSLWPGADANALAYTVTYLVPLVQVPPRGIWGSRGQATWLAAERWLGTPLAEAPGVAGIVLRYLAAYGPAAPADVTAWSGVGRVKEVFDHLRPELVTFRNERGRELFDLPDAPRPDPDTPAPVRFLPEYDNVLFSHADRSRILAGHAVPAWPGNGSAMGPLLVDGMFAGTWRILRGPDAVTVRVKPFAPLPTGDRDAVMGEGQRLAGFVAGELPAEVRVVAPR